jgi:transcriptional regulator with XRE-family HTH domain
LRRQRQDPPEDYGAWLRFYREEVGMTQRELAKKADVGYVSINHLENDRRWATPDMTKALSKVLRVAPSELFPSAGTPSPSMIVRAYLRRTKRGGKKR